MMRPRRKRTYWKAYAEAKAKGLDPAAARQQARQVLRGADTDAAWRGYERAIARQAKAATAFTVVKDAQGRDRWAAISSTAYRDRDGEIVSTAALRGAVALADAGGQPRGPLRFWHLPGADIGDCDFQALAADGRVLIESGTFRRPAYAAAVKAAAGGYQMSIGFTHPPSEPDAAGVFRTIQIFERSLVPAGRASNPFTRVTTKETAMRPEQLAALKTLLGDQGAAELLATAAQTDKAAQAAGVAFKEAPAQAVYSLPDGTQGVIVGGQFVALKAVDMKAPMPPEQMMQAAMTEATDAAARAGAEALAVPEPISDDTELAELTVGAFRQLVGEAVLGAMGGSPADFAAKMAEMKQQYEAMGKAFGTMKDDSAAREGALARRVDQLGAQLDAFTKAIKEFTDDLPASGYRASQGGPDEQPLAQAQKAAGPAAPLSIADQIAATLPPALGGMSWPYDVPPPQGVNLQQHAAPGAKQP